VFNFDQRAVFNQRNALLQQQRKNTQLPNYRSDNMFEQIEVTLDSYQVSANDISSAVNLKLSWKNISADAKQYPAISQLQKLATARNGIRSLLQRDDLLRIDTAKSGGRK